MKSEERSVKREARKMKSEKSNSSHRQIVFDVMLHGRFVCTLRMPITFGIIKDYMGDKPVIDERALTRFVEQQRPSLIGKPYRIEF